MIISHKNRFIFFHNKKTSGTSLEVALSKICGEEDYVSYSSDESEVLRKKLLIKNNKNNTTHKIDLKKSYANISSNIKYFLLKILFKRNMKLKRFNRYIVFKEKYYGHISPTELKNKISLDIWQNYFKFGTYRSFSDQFYSMYNHHMVFKNRIKYEDYFNNFSEKFFDEIFQFYNDEDVYWLNFASIQNSLSILEKKIKINFNIYECYKNINLRSDYVKFSRELSSNSKNKLNYYENLIKDKINSRLLI